MFELGTREIVIIVALIVLLFGSKKIPELTKNIVQAIKNLGGVFEGNDKKTGDIEKKQ
ncbi:MAG: twin-arginine translocase TatA/TatE family subunit [Candidatus Yonathbacteria bacterium]|nr:twin-arginine translocase TatA/TatE family subunit [Candidatus Yonathbacteria bacterium]